MAEVEKDAKKFQLYFGSDLNWSSQQSYLKVRGVSIKIIKNQKTKDYQEVGHILLRGFSLEFK